MENKTVCEAAIEAYTDIVNAATAKQRSAIENYLKSIFGEYFSSLEIDKDCARKFKVCGFEFCVEDTEDGKTIRCISRYKNNLNKPLQYISFLEVSVGLPSMVTFAEFGKLLLEVQNQQKRYEELDALPWYKRLFS